MILQPVEYLILFQFKDDMKRKGMNERLTNSGINKKHNINNQL